MSWGSNSDQLTDCLLANFTVRNMPGHALEIGCRGAEAYGLTVAYAAAGHNSPYNTSCDCVDVHGPHFHLHDSFLECGDDNVAVHASHVLVEDVVCGSGHGLSVGSDRRADFENITFRNAVFRGTSRVARIKTVPGVGKNGVVANGTIRRVVWEGMHIERLTGSFSEAADDVLTIDQFYCADCPPRPVGPSIALAEIELRGVTGHTTHGFTVACQPTSPPCGVSARDVLLPGAGGWRCRNAAVSARNVTPPPQRGCV